MAQTSPAEIKIPSLHQIGIVVKDVEKTAQNYWNIITIQAPSMRDRTYHGKPAYFESKIGLCQVGPLELELLEVLEGRTVYGDFMAEHGEGAHHLQYMTDSVADIDKHVEILSQKGFPMVMGGQFGNNGAFVYYDTVSALKTAWEACKMPDEFSGLISTARYPANETEISPAKVKIRSIPQIGIAVKSLEEVMENYWNILGIGPWDVIEVVPPALHDVTYLGKPSNYTLRVALTKVGPVAIELIQSISGSNGISDFICEHGEGIHHIQFEVDDLDEFTRIMNSEGFPTLMSGRILDGGYAYYDTVGPLKIICDALQPIKKEVPMTRYP